ncbi:MAG: hypothetical protein ACK4N4_07710 [Burkholderiales bacterium]
MKNLLVTCCAALIAAAPLPAGAADATQRKAPRKIERLSCMLGTEDRHARIAVELVNGAVQSFAYYSKWKPRTCSVHIERDDAYSKWRDDGRLTTVATEKGDFLIENRRENVHFIFREVERERYCGAEGRINGTLTVWRGKSQCELSGVMDDDPNETDRGDRPESAAAQPAAPDALAGPTVYITR